MPDMMMPASAKQQIDAISNQDTAARTELQPTAKHGRGLSRRGRLSQPAVPVSGSLPA